LVRKGLPLLPFVLLAALFGVSLTQGATGGPDAAGYTFIDNQETNGPAFSYQDISATGTNIGNSCDDCATVGVPIGFSFDFYGATHTTANIVSNGNLQFTTANSGFTNPTLPTAAIGPTLLPFWDDLRTDCSDDAIYVRTVGAPGSRQFIVQWRLVPAFVTGCAGGRIDFELIMFEGTNEILFQYADVIFGGGGPDSGSSATVGIQGSSTVALTYSLNTPSLANGRAICFRPPSSNPNVICGRTIATNTPTATSTATVTPTAEPTRLRRNVGGAAGAIAGAVSDQAEENRERAAAAAAPQATVAPPRTGTGVTIAPPSTGDAGLADQPPALLWPLLALGAGAAGAASLALARRR
jgi:hypothetical protein